MGGEEGFKLTDEKLSVQNVIFDILAPFAFQKYSICCVF